jgi:nucleoside-diphosphate-sugar epimerase
MTVLPTGAAGFIGAYVARALLARGERVDNLSWVVAWCGDYFGDKL